MKDNQMENSGKVEKLYTKRALTYESLYVNRLGWGKELYTFFRNYNYLKSQLKVLDAGCGTGVITRTLNKIVNELGYDELVFNAFDLTQGMLDIFQKQITEEGLNNIELARADVLNLDSLPNNWNEYDLIISSALLEYIPKEQISNALVNLKQLLKEEGKMLIFITRRNFVTNLTGKLWWKTNLFEEDKFQKILRDVGFRKIEQRNLQSRWSKYIMVFEVTK
ncbi:class I SAM-dependent methyltransferase [Alteribacillus bidgolensis]|uniref:Methyltransferase domain-containing protein n=1 Tax=Alteribacillus bidgolensis TaxID=930129 RepID=A0A1G8RLH0_9BACI|nr:class I SAM-dependent methyltransferase [Alteribacillus bidgolensis]SDJ17827.1 Methyltransferase domain-containing protein [Alteribacillus bidgolensis]